MTREYLKLALKYPDYFRFILAVTFTNKATEEMKNRILETLQDLYTKGHPLKYELGEALGLDDKELKERAEKVLLNMLHNYSAFSISTIDSFFQKVVRTFAREIGVQGGFQVELNQKKVISESVDRLMLEVGKDKVLTNWLADFAIFNITQGKKWDSKKDIKSLSDELFKELFILKKEIIFEKMDDASFMNSYITSLHNIVKEFESTMQKIGVKGVALMKSKGLGVDDFTRKKTGVGAYFMKLSLGINVKPNSYVMAAFTDNVWYAKASDKKEIIDEAVNEGLHALLEHSIYYRQDNYIRYFTATSVVRNIYALGILSKVNQYLHQYRDENDTLLISDFPVFLNEIIRDSDTPYIYEKIGSRYNHYLIDEFQDTSGLQWNNFKPLVKDSIAANQFNMIVGDIKQSIYRWRGGNWKLLLEEVQKDVGEDTVSFKELNINWRSKKNIIDFNNRLFELAPILLYDNLKKSTSLQVGSIDSIKDAYQDAYQQVADKDNVLGGLANVKFFESEKKDEFVEQSLEVMIERIIQLQSANYQLRDIAILVRTAREGKKVTDALIEYKKKNSDSKYRFDIISNDSLFLKNSPVVNLLIQILYYILDENESLHLAQLKYAFNWHLNDEEGVNEDVELILNPHLDRLGSLAIVDLIEELIRIFDLKSNIGQVPYLLAFQDAVLDFSKNKNAGVEGFLLWWQENNQRAIQVSESQDAMKLMTIHKSKGLQFKTVILPFCSWDLNHRSGGDRQNIIWCDTTDKKGFSSLPYLPLKYKEDMIQTYFSANYWDEKAKAYMDNLNLLYVACTRAEEALYVMAQKPKSGNSFSKVSDVLHLILSKENDGVGDWEEENLEFNIGEVVGFSVYEEDTKVEEKALQHIISHPWNERKELQSRRNEFWVDENVKAKISQGKLIHWVLSKVRYAEDLERAIANAIVEFNPKKEMLAEFELKINKLFENELVKSWFENDWQVKNEMNILSSNGSIQRPDRVIIKGNEAVVIDYKLGNISDRHHKQVKSYCILLSEMGYANVKGYLLYLNESKVVEV